MIIPSAISVLMSIIPSCGCGPWLPVMRYAPKISAWLVVRFTAAKQSGHSFRTLLSRRPVKTRGRPHTLVPSMKK